MKRIPLRTLLLDGLIITLWFTSAGLVIVHEQGRLWGGGMKLLTSLGATMDVQEQWFGIYYGDQKVGFASTKMMPEERDGVPGISISDHGQLSFSLLGRPQEITLSARTFIDADFRLQDFLASIRTADYRMQWSGHREGDDLVIILTTDESTLMKRVADPSGNAMVSGLSSWLAFHEFGVGQWGEVWMLNPLSLSPEVVHFTVRRRESLHGEEVFVVETDVRGVTARSWVTPDGRVLKEESAMGWTLLQESPRVAMAIPEGQAPTLDLLSTLAVPIDRSLGDTRRLKSLTLLVEGAREEDLPANRMWQTVLPAKALASYRATAPEGSWSLLWMRRPSLPDAPAASVPDAVARYLRASPFIQSDDPRIRAQALDIVGTLTDPWRQAVALNTWVHGTLAKRLTVGLPTAVDVLLSPSGDCHEHTVLYTALSRSLGIPTRAMAGLVYYQGRLYYHAWPEVWVGAWIPTDPTLGQRIADVSHVALVEAENEQLIGLAQFVGQLKVSVLATGVRSDRTQTDD